MYKITHFDKKLCHLLRHHLVDESMCDIYSIWNFSPRSRWKTIKNIYSGRVACRAQLFPIIYWLVLIISILGSVYSLCEFTTLFWGYRKHVTVWRQRTYYVLPPSVLRKCRLVGSFIILNAWLLLSYAVVKVSPNHMTPWLTINTFVLVSDLIIFFTEVLTGVCKLELCTLISFTLAMLNYLFVRCVQGVFLNAIEMNEADDIRLWKSS